MIYVLRTDLFTRNRLLLDVSRSRRRRRRLTFADGVARRAAVTAAVVGEGRRRLGRRGCQPTGVEIHGHRHHDPKGEGP